MVTTEHSGQIETWMLTLRDTVLLSNGLLSVLQHHRNPEGWRHPDGGGVDQPISTPFLPPAPTPLEPALLLLLKCEDGEPRLISVSAGYRRRSHTYLMYDFHARRTGSCGIMRIDGLKKLSWVKPLESDHLPYDKWKLFGTLRVGAKCEFGTVACVKVSVKQIGRKLRDKTCTVTGWF